MSLPRKGWERESGAESHGWLDDALAASAACGWAWDRLSGSLELTPGAALVLGAAPETLEALGSLIHEDDRAARASVVKSALDRGKGRPRAAKCRAAVRRDVMKVEGCDGRAPKAGRDDAAEDADRLRCGTDGAGNFSPHRQSQSPCVSAGRSSS